VLLGGGGEPRLGAGPAEVVGTEGYLLAHAPQHVGDGHVLGAEVAHVVDRHGPDTEVVGELQGAADPGVVAGLVRVGGPVARRPPGATR
jgi:hypothetical protein